MKRRSFLAFIPFLSIIGKRIIENKKNMDSFSISNRPHPDTTLSEDNLRYFHKILHHAENYRCPKKFRYYKTHDELVRAYAQRDVNITYDFYKNYPRITNWYLNGNI